MEASSILDMKYVPKFDGSDQILNLAGLKIGPAQALYAYHQAHGLAKIGHCMVGAAALIMMTHAILTKNMGWQPVVACITGAVAFVGYQDIKMRGDAFMEAFYRKAAENIMAEQAKPEGQGQKTVKTLEFVARLRQEQQALIPDQRPWF